MITAQQKNSHRPVCLVTGGAGFVGSFLCETLLWQNCQVICLDNFSTGKKENLTKCLKNPNFVLVKHDLHQPLPKKVKDLFLESSVNYVFDLAGVSNATQTLLDLAAQSGVKVLIVNPTASEISLGKADWRIVNLRDVYGPRMNLKEEGDLVKIINSAVHGDKLEIPNEGMDKIRPVFIADAVYGLTKAIFGVDSQEQVFNLMSPQEISLLNFALEVEKQSGQDLKIEFVNRGVRGSSSSLIDGLVFDWQPTVSWEEGIGQLLKFFEKEKKPMVFPEPVQKKQRPLKSSQKSARSRKGRSGWFLFLLTFLLILAYPLISLFFSGFLGTVYFKKAKDNFLAADFEKAVSSAYSANHYYAQTVKKLNQLRPILGFFKQEEIIDQGEKVFSLVSQAASGVNRMGAAAYRASLLLANIFQDEAKDNGQLVEVMDQSIIEIKTELDLAFRQFSLIEAELENNQSLYQLADRFGWADWLERGRGELPELTALILQIKKGIGFIPDLTGINQKQTYLVLLQNSSELRPTGGFIGSFALLTFDKGRLLDFEVQDVYWADGQLKGHVEPPAKLKEYLGEANWYLRDSNWHPDFPNSAQQAAWFLEKETGRRVNGVIAVDLYLVQRLLEATGEIQLTDFKEKINSQNLFERAEYYSEVGFFPGSTQKQDFLASLTRALFTRLREADQGMWLQLMKGVHQSLASKDLLVYLSNNRLASQMMAELTWDGGLREIKCGQETGNCLIDYLMIVEANVGVNKANYFVKRDLAHQVEINDRGTVKEKLRITYHNTSSTEVFPGGRYKNYLRILTPLGTRLDKVMIDNQSLEEEKIIQEDLLGKASFGFLVEVGVQEKRTIEVSYRLDKKLTLSEKSQYLFLLQKQPGIEDKDFRFYLDLPQSVAVLSAQPEATITDQGYLFAPRFNQDIIFETYLVK